MRLHPNSLQHYQRQVDYFAHNDCAECAVEATSSASGLQPLAGFASFRFSQCWVLA
jgi:hypothetical protein